MTIEDVITALERVARLIDNNIVLVLQKEVEQCRIKVFKKFKYTLWYIDKSSSSRTPIYIIEKTSRIESQEDEDNIIREIETQLAEELFKHTYYKGFNYIQGDNYDGNEQLLDSDN